MHPMNTAQVITPRLRLGLIINPYAGIGGPEAFKGSDSIELIANALAQGAPLRAPERALRCLKVLFETAATQISIVTYPGLMGADATSESGFEPTVLGRIDTQGMTNAQDTQTAAKLLLDEGVDLLLFVGGDGTARDICAVVSEQVPVLGIPAGVKMQSGVFAVSPEVAAEVVLNMLVGGLVDLRSQEVRDLDEESYRQGKIKSQYFGELQVPQCGHFVQQTKQGGTEVEELVLDDIAADILEKLEPDVWYLLGAGTSVAAVAEQLGVSNSLLGVDVVCNETLLYRDVSAEQLHQYLQQFTGKVVAVLSVTGGQGSLLGRGNQQLSPWVLRRVGRDNIWALATKTKIRELEGRPLLLDSNDVELDAAWCGYIPVVTGYHDSILYPLGLFGGSK